MSQDEDNPGVSLCLSGGGFRATLFHLGVVTALRRMGVLRHVRDIYSVSGGSIVAAHVVLNWEHYVDGQDKEFHGKVQELLEFTKHDVRGRIIRRWLLFGWLPFMSRIEQLVRHYGSLYKHATLQQLAASGRPRLFICSTSMVSGNLCCFHARGFTREVSTQKPKDVFAPGLAVSMAVAASSAFPPLFPPVVIKAGDVGSYSGELLEGERLTDGGVFDNLGVRAAQLIPRAGALLLLSDASAGFEQIADDAFGGVVARTARTTDILMQRVASLEQQVMACQPLTIGISDTVDRGAMQSIVLGQRPYEVQALSTQQWIKSIRTDLDDFSDAEVACIFKHGFEVAISRVSELTGKQIVQLDGDALDLCLGQRPSSQMKAQDVYAHLIRARKRRVRLWNSTDPVSWWLAVVAAALLSLATVGLRLAG